MIGSIRSSWPKWKQLETRSHLHLKTIGFNVDNHRIWLLLSLPRCCPCPESSPLDIFTLAAPCQGEVKCRIGLELASGLALDSGGVTLVSTGLFSATANRFTHFLVAGMQYPAPTTWRRRGLFGSQFPGGAVHGWLVLRWKGLVEAPRGGQLLTLWQPGSKQTGGGGDLNTRPVTHPCGPGRISKQEILGAW